MNDPSPLFSDDSVTAPSAAPLAAEKAVPAPPRQPPGVFRFMPPLIRDLWAEGVNLSVQDDGGIGVGGFYHSGGSITLRVSDDGSVVAVDHRKREHPIRSFDDLVALNFAMWKAARAARPKDNPQPDSPWSAAFAKHHWVRRVVSFVPRAHDDPDERVPDVV